MGADFELDCGGLAGHAGEAHGEEGAAFWCAAGVDLAAVADGGLADDGEAESGAGEGACLAGPIEAVEHPG